MAWESSHAWHKCLAPRTHLGDPGKGLGSWLQIDSAPAVIATRGVNQWLKDLSTCPILSLCNFSLKWINQYLRIKYTLLQKFWNPQFSYNAPVPLFAVLQQQTWCTEQIITPVDYWLKINSWSSLTVSDYVGFGRRVWGIYISTTRRSLLFLAC